MKSVRSSFPTLAAAIMATGFSAAALSQETPLDTVVVTASGYEQEIKEAPASISVITREELDKAPVSSIAEVLGTLPGVTGGYTAAGAGSKISFRGMPDKYTLILIDGKRIGSSALLGHRPDTLAQDLNWLSTEDIERIEVVRGAMSTLYGSEAMGGVINIITKKVATKWTGSLASNFSVPDAGGRGDTWQNSFSVSGPLSEKLGLRVGGNYTKRDADEASNGSTGSRDSNFNAKLSLQANADHFFSLEASRGRSSAIDFPNAGERDPGATEEVFGAGKMLHESFAVGHEGKFGDVKTKLDFYVNTYKNESGPASEFDGAKSKESVLDFKADIPVKLGVDQMLTMGLQYKEEELQNPGNIGNLSDLIVENGGQPVSVERNPENWAWSAFVEDQLFLRDNLTLTLGVRGDKSANYDLNFSPRAYAVYHPTEAWTVRGGVSRGYRAPNLKESSGTSATSSMGMGCASLVGLGWTNASYCYMAGNPNLKPEKSTNYELGFGYDNEGRAFGLTYFRSQIKDMMQNGALGLIEGVWLTQQYNVEEAETEGLEASFTLPLNSALKLAGNATYMMEAKNKSTGARLNMTPEWTGNLSLNWRNNAKLSTYVAAQYIGKQLYAPAANGTNNFTDSNYTIDLGANYDVHKHLTLRTGVQNITNNVAKTDDDYGDGSPRTFYIGMTARF